MGQLISIILPIYNQAGFIETIVEKYEKALEKVHYPHETILVTNGCTDNSEEICRSLIEKYKSVRVKNSVNGSWGLAVKLGLAEANGDLLCYTNSSRTSPQDLVLLLFYSIANPGVVIKAERKIRESWYRRLGSLLYNLECRSFFDLPYWDINGTPKVFPRKFDKLLNLVRDDDLIDLEFNIICRQEGYPMLGVPILRSTRHGGRSTTNIHSAVKMYRGVYQMWRSISRSGK